MTAPPLTGRLLVASPVMRDPNFSSSVILVCAHDADGAVGLVLDRPTRIPVAAHLPSWSPRVVEPPVVFTGGPVQPEMAVVVGDGDTSVAGWSPIVGTTGLLDIQAADPDDTGRIRVFAGYAGWSAGQLETEVTSLDWIVVAAHPDDAFDPHPVDSWRRALDRRGGLYAAYAHFPEDPSVN